MSVSRPMADVTEGYDFCTYFDHRYLSRALALYRSLVAQSVRFRLFAICLDDEARRLLAALDLPGLTAIELAEVERHEPRLLRAKTNRSLVEYYFTLSPAVPLYLFERFADLQVLTYLDADLYFFAHPAPLFARLSGRSIGVIEHRFPRKLARLARFGRFNVGWLTFRRDEQGLDCLRTWNEECLAWCYDRLEGERYADQKYLDAWPGRYSGLAVLDHPGANVAPWNLADVRILGGAAGPRVQARAEGEGTARASEVPACPLIFFHFQGFKELAPGIFDTGLYRFREPYTPVLRDLLFAPYHAALLAATELLATAGTTCAATVIRDLPPPGIVGLVRRLKRRLKFFYHLRLRRDYLIARPLANSRGDAAKQSSAESR